MQRGFFDRNWIVGYVVGSLVVALGIFVMFQQESFLRFFVILLGLFAVISSTVQLIGLSAYRLNPFFHRTTLIRTIVSIIVGLFVIIVPLTAAKISWTLLLYTIATVLGLSAVISLLDALLATKAGRLRLGLLGDGLFSLAVSILLFAFPQEIGTIVIKVVGILIILFGLLVIVIASRGRAYAKRVQQHTIEGEGELLS